MMRPVAALIAVVFITCAGVSAQTDPSYDATLTWRPPQLSNPVYVDVLDSDGSITMDPARDYVLRLSHLTACGGLVLDGGHNVTVIGGQITISGPCSSAYDRTAIKVRANTGTVHLEGLLIDGAYTHDGIVAASPQTTLQVENVRIESVRTLDENHSDCLQTQAGLGRLRVDRFTCVTELQGFFLKNEGGSVVGPVDIRNTNLTGSPGKHLFFQESPDIPVRLSNVWLFTSRPWASFGFLVYPQEDGRTSAGTYDRRRRAVVSRNGKRLWFVGSNVTGVISKGSPRSGDFVPKPTVGQGYVSPGYVRGV